MTEYKQFVYHFCSMDSIDVREISAAKVIKKRESALKIYDLLEYVDQYAVPRRQDAETARKLLEDHFPECLI